MLAYPTVHTAAIRSDLHHKISIEIVLAVAVAAFVAAWVVAFQSFSTQVQTLPQPLAAKADRIDNRLPIATCSQQPWPYYEPSCVRHRDQQAGAALAVRIVPIDRIQKPNLATAIEK